MKKVHVYILSCQIIAFFFPSFLFVACTNKPALKKDDPGQQKADTTTLVQYKKPAASFNDTMVITNPSAVFFNPDSLQLEKIKAISKKENYETELHNCFYLMRNARTVLNKYWPSIHIIETKTNQYLLFIKKDKTKTCIDLNSQGDMCGIFLFDGKKEPELADMMNIDTALRFYFDK